ncbi:gephyrin-like molybdotransferase Glp [Microlunatus sp. Gsoil 973]|jgi:molybdopterin molybdotransferase|uniref:molybdotransferase-like divisome protein Glp n=1 Tax=Microlunatus sp. Gsoil 973 TaxID=2672569 RepID=UPI0012B46F2C|nr:gephyrin-like molybdotransferase Glp [Microlunatus sp. Gsoil 973]QGN33596.1 molybdopterin molybdenumtransferase MoeA [Microlunatus sp. Gsoil 973]
MPLFGRKRTKDEPVVAQEEFRLPEPPVPGPNGMRSMTDHRDYLLSCVDPLPPFGQQILDAVGLTLCEDVESPINLPRFDNSSMDGYAVRAQDVHHASTNTPISLPVVGEVPAGAPAPHRLSPGTAMKIMTGAMLPEGADSVVPYEATDRGEQDVRINEACEPGNNVRRVGEDITEGEVVLREGERLASRAIGLLAGIGIDKVMVRPRPRVVVISTGDELTEPGFVLPGEQNIYDANSYMLAAAAKAAGAQVFRVGLVPDDPERLKQVISDQLVRADLILTTGGVSQGDYDIVKQVLPELGATDFTQVAMQPGKPQGFGLIGEDNTPIIMMPGNPVSAFVSFEAFVRPVLRKLAGLDSWVRRTVQCSAARAISSAPGKLQFARGVVSEAEDGSLVADLASGHGSHLLGGLAGANALLLLDEQTDFIAAGDEVGAWLLIED